MFKQNDDETTEDIEIDKDILVIVDNIKTLNGREPLLSTVYLINSMPQQQDLPLPRCCRVIPIYCACLLEFS